MSPRLTALLVVAVAALALVPGTAAADPIVTYVCSPPSPPAADNCAKWNTAPVLLHWGFPAAYHPVLGDCSDRTFTADTAGTDVQCVVRVGDTGDVQFATATVRLDRTPPVVTTMSAVRPPDYDGWWNHPVAFAFAGTDATSGIGVCDTINYSGPDGDAAKVTGSCTDVAGNAASGSFPIKYDATPPSVSAGAAKVKAGRVSLQWSTSTDAVTSHVMRSPGIGGTAVSDVYSGPNKSFTDSGVKAGHTYTYSINAQDQAGNVATATVVAKAAAKRAPRLDWPSVRGADYYNVQVFRNGRKILSAWPRHSRLQLKKRWRYAGKRRTLSAGTYSWYAWPGFGRRSAQRYGKLIASRRFRISRD
jgi:hypothetical protein